jgi:hypothetical protein
MLRIASLKGPVDADPPARERRTSDNKQGKKGDKN